MKASLQGILNYYQTHNTFKHPTGNKMMRIKNILIMTYLQKQAVYKIDRQIPKLTLKTSCVYRLQLVSIQEGFIVTIGNFCAWNRDAFHARLLMHEAACCTETRNKCMSNAAFKIASEIYCVLSVDFWPEKCDTSGLPQKAVVQKDPTVDGKEIWNPTRSTMRGAFEVQL